MSYNQLLKLFYFIINQSLIIISIKYGNRHLKRIFVIKYLFKGTIYEKKNYNKYLKKKSIIILKIKKLRSCLFVESDFKQYNM